MRGVVRWLIVALIVIHALIHLIGVGRNPWWVVPALLLAGAALALALRRRWWWLVLLAAVLVSQVAVTTEWRDARAGTVINLALLLAVAYGFASRGPVSARAELRRRARRALREVPRVEPGDVVTDSDLEALPAPVAEYLRHTGAVGQPRVVAFRARVHGRIRAGADQPWMTFRGEQVNTYGSQPNRLFYLNATMKGLPVDVLHVYADGRATMRVRLCSMLPMVRASGPELTQAETVTLFNELCVMAPAAIIDAPVAWEPLDEHRAGGTFTHAGHSVRAELVTDEVGQLVDFVSDDRLRASANGRTFLPQRWSTPLTGYRELGGRRLASLGAARWHAPEPEGEFCYLEFVIDKLVVNPGPDDVTTR